MAAKPPVRLRSATPADSDAIGRLINAAFEPGVISRILYPHGRSADTTSRALASFFAGSGPGSEIHIVVAELPRQTVPEDGSPEEYDVVACGKYVVFRHARSEEEWNTFRERTADIIGPEANLDAHNIFHRSLHKTRSTAMQGDPAVYLSVLATDPRFQGLGAGSAILRWGAELADSAGLTSWLDASAAGYSIYLRNGYVPVDKVDFPIADRYGAVKEEGQKWGEESAPEAFGPLAEGSYRNVLMKRVPQTRKTHG